MFELTVKTHDDVNGKNGEERLLFMNRETARAHALLYLQCEDV